MKSLALTRLTTFLSGAGPALQKIKAQTKIKYMVEAILERLLRGPLWPHEKEFAVGLGKKCVTCTHKKGTTVPETTAPSLRAAWEL